MRLIAGLLMALVVPVSLALAAPAPKQVSIEDLFKRSEVTDLQISPTGQHIAMTVPLEDGDVILVIVDQKTMQRTATMRAAGNDVIDSFWWANDTRVVATVAEKVGGVDKPKPTGELYAVNADGSGSGSQMIFGYRGQQKTGTRIKQGAEKRNATARPISRVPDKDRRILIATYDWKTKDPVPAIESLDIYSGQSQRVGQGPAPLADLIADNKGQVRAAQAMGVNQNNLVYWRAPGVDNWSLLNDSDTSGIVMKPLRFARDNQRLYVQMSEPKGADALYLLDPATGKKELLYKGNADPERLLITADEQDAYAVLLADGKTTVHVIDAESPEGRITRALADSFPGQTAAFTSFSRDGKVGLVNVSSDTNPGDFYLFDMVKKTADYQVSARRWIEPEEMSEMQPISFVASDGVTLHGYLTLPRGSDGKNLPMVVNPHGGPHNVRDYWSFNPEVQLLANRGYAVLQLNFRGSGGYGQKFMESGYRQWGMRMQDDLTDATRWAIKQGYADADRICLYGASYGGYAALMGAVREPDLYRCTIGYVGVYDLNMMHLRGDTPDSLWGRNYLRMAVGDNRSDMERRSPVAGVDRIKAAVMLVHGGRDERVPVAQANALRSALDKRGHPYEWLLKDNEGHGFYVTANQVELYTKVLAFLDKHTAVKPASVKP